MGAGEGKEAMTDIERRPVRRRDLTIEQQQKLLDAYRRWERFERLRTQVHPPAVVRRVMGLYARGGSDG